VTAFIRCDHGGRPCPRIIQALPRHRPDEGRRPPPGAATLVVVAFILVMFLAGGVVPAIAGALPW
jgi:hypothetical protein